MITNRAGEYTKKSQLGEYDRIVCNGCEAIWQEWDNYAQRLLAEEPLNGRALYRGNRKICYVVDNYEYSKLKLFFISMVWRASVSRRKFFERVSLGQFEDIAKKHIMNSDPDIYAGGDCVENVNRITQQKMLAPLRSTANKHGRVIGTNITGGCETFPGVLGTIIAKVFDDNVARVGLGELQAREAGYDVVTSLVPGYEYVTYYPKGKEILVRLVAASSDNRLLGGQVVGPGEVAKRVDVLATALTFGATADDLANLDLAYAPPYNSAMDPLHNAANVIRNKHSGYARTLALMKVKSKLENGESFIFLDGRSPDEWEKCRIEAPQTRLLPLKELRKKLDALPKDVEIVTYCRASVRAYQAQRILEGAGFKNVKFMDGSIAAWPYEILGTRSRSDDE